MQKPDALAIIGLAQTCSMYEANETEDHHSFQVGICYNNIANLQLKNGRYELAYENFTCAIKVGEQK